jgi:hypothetical protein
MSDYYDGVLPVAMPIIKDNYGVFWGYDGERISVLDKSGELVEGGYWCQTFEEGISFLENDGYIDREPTNG